MKMSKKAARAFSCSWFLTTCLLLLFQVIILCMKIFGDVNWSWWATLSPLFIAVGLPTAILTIAYIILLPKAMIEERRRSKRVDAEAAKYGMVRQPGESTGDLKKRIVCRNMIEGGNYSRKAIKDAILDAFPDVGSCQIQSNYQKSEILLILRPAGTLLSAVNFNDDMLRDIAEFAAPFLPISYTIKAINAEDIKNGK